MITALTVCAETALKCLNDRKYGRPNPSVDTTPAPNPIPSAAPPRRPAGELELEQLRANARAIRAVCISLSLSALLVVGLLVYAALAFTPVGQYAARHTGQACALRDPRAHIAPCVPCVTLAHTSRHPPAHHGHA